MSRYRVPDHAEVQFEPGSNNRVLKNLLHITDPREMDEVERIALQNALVRLGEGEVTAQTCFTAQAICHIHKVFLGGIYEWAGRYRNVQLATKDGPQWPPPNMIPELMGRYEAGVLAKYTPGRAAPLKQLAENLARIHGELVLIHPFRDGNGRTARLLVDLVAMQANEPPLNWRFRKMARQEYFRAISGIFENNYDDLTRLTVRALIKGRAGR